MKYQLKGVMASTEKDSINLGYPTVGGGKRYARVIIAGKILEKEMIQKYKIDYLTQGQKIEGRISTEELLCLEGETQQPLHQRSWTI